MQNQIEKCLTGVTELHLYVTGFTPALVEVLNWCSIEDVSVTLYHFNRDTNDYVPQSTACKRRVWGE